MAADAAAIAEAAKAAGNAAFKAGEYATAIAEFTKAIEADSTNHVLYSNRSGAYAANADFKEALLDANKCIELRGDWPKGHSRRGAAYVGLKNWPQAQTAYERAVELDPSSTVAKDELAKIKLRRQGSGNAARNAAAAAGYPDMTGGSAIGGPVTTGIAPTISLSAVVAGFFYVLPVLGAGIAMQCYRLSVLNILLLFTVNLWNTFPKQFATLADPKFKACIESQGFFLCIYMLLSPPMPFALMPFLAVAFLNVVHGYAAQIAKLPGFLATRLQFFTTPEGTFQAQAFGAVSEVIVTFMTPALIVVQGARAGILSFFYFQYVARRYNTNPQTKQTVLLLVERLDGFAGHRLVPAPVKRLYDSAKGFVAMVAARFK